MLKVTLEDIMTEHIVTINEETTVGQAAHLLLRFRINGVLVVKKKNRNKVLGIVTTTDLVKFLDKAFVGRKGKVSDLGRMSQESALKIASREVFSIQKDTKVSRLIRLMLSKRVYTVPVYDGDVLIGVVGRHDILNVAFSY